MAVNQQHDLRPDREGELLLRPVLRGVKLAGRHSPGGVDGAGQALEHRAVDEVGRPVGGSQRDGPRRRFEGRVRVDAGVQRVEVGVGGGAVADAVEQADEVLVPLPEDGVQLDRGETEITQGPGAEEEGARVRAQQPFSVVVGDDGWQLVQVADKDHLHAPKGLG